MDKVKLPKEVADAIEKLKSTGWKEEHLLNTVEFINSSWEPVIQVGHSGYAIAKYLGEGKFLEYAQALVNGYEVEQTPEDKVRDYYNAITPENWVFNNNANDPVYIERNAIRTTCTLLGIKIEGLNA